jgi:hypothetical protein
MKTRLHFSRIIMLMIVLMSTLGALAQTSQTLTQNVCPGSEPYLVVPGNVANTFQWSISTGTSGVNWTISTPDKASTNVIWANPAVPTTYTLTLTEMDIVTFCTTVVSVDVTVYPLPVDYTVTGGGSYCDGGSGLPVGLSGSQNGVNYQLQLGGVNSGSPIPGTGLALNFGTKTAAGTYTVVASTTAVKSCSVNMTGNAIIIINPLPIPTITGATPVCIGSSEIYATETGMTDYTWVVSAGGTITSGGTTSSPTVTITWNTVAPQTVSVIYTNASGCRAISPTVKPVGINPLPATSPIWHN